ncbi:hypothetical protein AMJ51_01810 [Microgenomates bacterium DG_75]|nr:MAG: hypothetical protein AMJ51_01810 [Microgenomates bacterium DG_75]
MRRKRLGKLGEKLALKHLRKNKYQILERNFHSQSGEIDIIAQEGDVLVFVEVKTRWSKKFGTPEEAITPGKIERIVKTGQLYQMNNPHLPEAVRIDAVAIELSPAGGVEKIELIKNV